MFFEIASHSFKNEKVCIEIWKLDYLQTQNWEKKIRSLDKLQKHAILNVCYNFKKYFIIIMNIITRLKSYMLCKYARITFGSNICNILPFVHANSWT